MQLSDFFLYTQSPPFIQNFNNELVFFNSSLILHKLLPITKWIIVDDEANLSKSQKACDDLKLESPSSKVIFVTTQNYTPKNYELIQQMINPAFIIPHDLTHPEIHAFLCALVEEIKNVNSAPEEDSLEKEYQIDAFDKIKKIQSLFEKFKQEQHFEYIQEMSNEAHKIAGSAATFGFKPLGDIARTLDISLLEILRKKFAPEHQMNQILPLLRKLLLSLQKLSIP